MTRRLAVSIASMFLGVPFGVDAAAIDLRGTAGDFQMSHSASSPHLRPRFARGLVFRGPHQSGDRRRSHRTGPFPLK